MTLSSTINAQERLRPYAGRRDLPRLFHLVVQAWGPSSCRTLTDICLPALLAPGNIPALTADWPARFVIFTRDQDIHRIAASSNYGRLVQLLPVEFKTIDEELRADRGSTQTKIHHRIVGAAAYEHAAIIWLVPDGIWSDGSLRTVSQAAAAGKRAVMQPTLRVLKEQALPLVTERLSDPLFDGFGSRELARICLDSLHPFHRACDWDAPRFNESPPLALWRVGAEGVLVRSFRLHPLMLFPSRTVAHFTSSFDDDLPLLACPDHRDFHIVKDSDDGFHAILTEEDWCETIPLREGRGDAIFLARWALAIGNLHHRRFLRHRIRIHAAECSAAWRTIERDSNRVVGVARMLVAMSGIARRPFELLFGQRRAPFLSGQPMVVPQTGGTSRRVRTFAWCRRHAYLFASGWVFGHDVACRRVGLDPSVEVLDPSVEVYASVRSLWSLTVRPFLWRSHKRVQLAGRHTRRRFVSTIDRAGTRLRKRRRKIARACRELPDTSRRLFRGARKWIRARRKDRRGELERVAARRGTPPPTA